MGGPQTFDGSGPGRPLRDRLVERVNRPGFFTGLFQILKCVAAATVAWWFSVYILETEMPFLSPWTALLTVHTTVYQSISRGLQTSISSALGVGLSFVVGFYLGVNVWTFALALLVGMLAARIKWIRDEGVAVATTAIFLLSSGFSDQQPLLLDRLIEVGIGVAAGIAVNFLIVPPLRDKQAAGYVDSINLRMGKVLVEIADEINDSWNTDKADSWLEETESMDKEVEAAWRVVAFAKESRRANLRNRVRIPGHSLDRRPPISTRQGGGYADILTRVDEGVSHLRHLARTLHQATFAEGDWEVSFRRQWAAITRDCGQSIADPDADVEPVRDRLTALSSSMARGQNLPENDWPIYGSLLNSLRHIAVIVDDVASSREARQER